MKQELSNPKEVQWICNIPVHCGKQVDADLKHYTCCVCGKVFDRQAVRELR
jgi:hypothetical protein